MAHVKLYRDDEGTARVDINGQDFTYEIFADSLRIGTAGDGSNPEYDEVCLDLKIALSRLDIGDAENVDAALLVGSFARMAAEVSP